MESYPNNLYSVPWRRRLDKTLERLLIRSIWPNCYRLNELWIPTFATSQGGPAEIIVDGISGFHIDPNNGDESSNKIADFFEKCKRESRYWSRMSRAGLKRIHECYTWKIYANKVLNMGLVYGFWRRLIKDQKQAKQRYIDVFYSLQFRELAKNLGIPGEKSKAEAPHETQEPDAKYLTSEETEEEEEEEESSKTSA